MRYPDVVGAIAMAVSMPGSWLAAVFWAWQSESGWLQPRAFGFMLPVCAFFWLWAFKNRLLGPIRNDAGVISFLPGMLAGVAAQALPVTVSRTVLDVVAAFSVGGAILPMFNFLVVIVWFVTSRAGPQKVAKRFDKSFTWAVVFTVYAWGSFLFWPASAVIGSIRMQATWWAALLGVPLSLLYAVALKKIADRLNAHLQTEGPRLETDSPAKELT